MGPVMVLGYLISDLSLGMVLAHFLPFLIPLNTEPLDVRGTGAS